MTSIAYTTTPITTAPVSSVAPVIIPTEGRETPLQVRVSAPVTGDTLPIILLSHGHGRSQHLSSLNGYAPLANFWAAHGFVVIQPTHLDSATLSLSGVDPDAPLYWRTRTKDMSSIIDNLDVIEKTVPELAGRLDHSRIAVVGHSLGGLTASMLLGARVIDPITGTTTDFADPRITSGVVLAAPGRGGKALSPTIPAPMAFLSSIDFTTLTTPALVVVGDRDDSSNLTVAGPAWHADPYVLAPGPTSILTLFGGEHQLGGITGYDVAETTDENPDRVAAVQWLAWAYLRTQLGLDELAWPTAVQALGESPDPLGMIDSK